MIEYHDYAQRVDERLQEEKLRIWRQLTLANGRPISLYASAERGHFAGRSIHLFLTYIKTASPDDFDRFSTDCFDYALKACQMPLAKQMISSCLILPCLATHTTFRELALAAEKTEKLKKGDRRDKNSGLKTQFLQTAIMPCLLNLTTHKSFHSGTQPSWRDSLLKEAEEILLKTVVSANIEKSIEADRR
ncbi:MAG: hypothetical protein K2Y39_02940 [Candidatus Obscuribacterales bacterium]|nr:hypothetical protein [Candidatus Obscuribacterales bacterium]